MISKQISAVFLVFILFATLLLSACGAQKTSISSETFKIIMEDHEYTIQDATSQLDEGSVSRVYIALKESYQIEFFEVATVQQASAAFEENKAKFEGEKEMLSKSNSISGNNFARYKQESSDQIKIISQIENTFLYIDASMEYEPEITAILSTLGY